MSKVWHFAKFLCPFHPNIQCQLLTDIHFCLGAEKSEMLCSSKNRLFIGGSQWLLRFVSPDQNAAPNHRYQTADLNLVFSFRSSRLSLERRNQGRGSACRAGVAVPPWMKSSPPGTRTPDSKTNYDSTAPHMIKCMHLNPRKSILVNI